MKAVLLQFVLLLALGACDTVEEPPVPESQVRTLTGVLRSDAASPEGVATGWVVDEAGTNVVMPVDVQLVVEEAQRMAGNPVRIRGAMVERTLADGTKRPVFVAQTIELAQR